MSKIYLENGYFNASYVFEHTAPIVVIIGGRGTGKTYGILKELIDRGEFFLHVRRSQTQLDIINKPEFTSFLEINEDTGNDITPFKLNKGSAGYYHTTVSDVGKLMPGGNMLGMTAALSTFANLRSISLSNVKTIFYDEFIPQPEERKIPHEGEALLNMYETVNRNRELKGENAVKMILASNSNSIYSSVLESLGITNTIEKMARRGTEVQYLEKRGILILQLYDSEISKRKRETALYNAANSQEFLSMAVSNSFYSLGFENIKPQPIKEYTPLFAVFGICVYMHKSGARYYVTSHKSGGIEEIRSDSVGLTYVRKTYNHLQKFYSAGKVFFENASCVTIFRDLWGF